VSGHGSAVAASGRPRCPSRRLAWKHRTRAKLVVVLVLSVAVTLAACGRGDEDADSGVPQRVTSTTRLLEQAPAPDPVTPARRAASRSRSSL